MPPASAPSSVKWEMRRLPSEDGWERRGVEGPAQTIGLWWGGCRPGCDSCELKRRSRTRALACLNFSLPLREVGVELS